MPKKKKQTAAIKKKRWYLRYWDKFVFLVLLGLFVLAIPGQNAYTLDTTNEKPTLRSVALYIPPPAPYPVNRTGIYPGPEITATGLVILDINSGVYLFKRNEDELLAPASTTKILTALVALD